MEHTFSTELFSDLHKEVNGFRPNGDHPFYLSDDEGKQLIWNFYLTENDFQTKTQALMEQERIISFEEEIQNAINYGAETREDAVRWIVASEDFQDVMDFETFVWNEGFLHTKYGRGLVEEIKLAVSL